MKTTKSAICGGFTSISWDGKCEYKRDTEAFLFNLSTKFTPNNFDYAIFACKEGLSFGTLALRLRGTELNKPNDVDCKTGSVTYYNIEGEVSPLTGEKNKF